MFTEFLVRMFVKEPENTGNLKVRQAYGELGGMVGVACNVALFAAKMTVGLISASIAVLADAVNNLSDAGSSVVALIGFRMAAKPADDEHPFGHGRLEYVAGLVIAVIIIAVGIDFFKSAAERIFHPVETVVSNWGMLAVALAIPVKFWMFLFNRKLGKKIDSTVLQATAFDSLSDILTTSVVLASAAVSRFTSFPADGYAGVAVAVLIILGGIKVVRTALLFKLGRREIRHTFQPRKVQVVRFEGKGVEEGMLSQVAMFFCVYVLMLLLGAFAISLEGRFDVETNLTAALTCLSNVGPGLGAVGPVENFAGYGPFAKLVLSLLMLAGRLELFPILALFHPAIWRKS